MYFEVIPLTHFEILLHSKMLENVPNMGHPIVNQFALYISPTARIAHSE